MRRAYSQQQQSNPTCSPDPVGEWSTFTNLLPIGGKIW